MNRANKKGNIYIVFISICVILQILIFTGCFLIFMQVNDQVYRVKQDIFYIVQNSYLALSQENLAYSNYTIDNYALTQKVNDILNLNYSDKSVEIKKLKYNLKTNRVEISYLIKIKPVALESLIGNINLNLKEEIKLKGMEVE